MISTLFQSFQFPPGRNSERDFFIRHWRIGNFIKNDGDNRLKTSLTSWEHYFIIISGNMLKKIFLKI